MRMVCVCVCVFEFTLVTSHSVTSLLTKST